MRALAALSLVLCCVGCNAKGTINCTPAGTDAGPVDAGNITDAGGTTDAGAVDAGTSTDAGSPVDAGSASDGGGITTPHCTDSEDPASDGGPTLAVTLSLNGAINFAGQGPFNWGDAGNCQGLVGRYLQASTVQTPSGSAQLALALSPTYVSSGSYAVNAGSLVLGTTDGGAADGGTAYAPSNIGSDTTVQVNSDYSGTITITQWGDPAHNVENGTLSWTCAP